MGNGPRKGAPHRKKKDAYLGGNLQRDPSRSIPGLYRKKEKKKRRREKIYISRDEMLYSLNRW